MQQMAQEPDHRARTHTHTRCDLIVRLPGVDDEASTRCRRHCWLGGESHGGNMRIDDSCSDCGSTMGLSKLGYSSGERIA